jgi:hypothetical protein
MEMDASKRPPEELMRTTLDLVGIQGEQIAAQATASEVGALDLGEVRRGR